VTTIRAIVEYDGTNFCGMQYQPAQRSVAGELERTFGKLLSVPVKIAAAGRTDSGVHATGQVVSFQTDAAFPFERLAIAANAVLPRDVTLRAAHVAQEPFSARFSALERTYVYAIYNGREPSALLARYCAHVWAPIDLSLARAGAAALIGEHDFRSFCGTLPQSGPTVRTVTKLACDREREIVRIEIRADGFLRRMVRTIVGTLIECATGRRDPESVGAILAARDRATAGATAPARGLYLAGVRYPDGFDSFREPPPTRSVSR
jgi:tRNA pseudouridine38-40 synthase